MAAQKYTLFNRPEYFAELVRRVTAAQAGEQVIVTSFTLKPDYPEIAAILEALRGAARRGVQVRLMVDAFNFIVSAGLTPGPLFFGRKLTGKLRAPFRQRLEALEGLREAGGQYVILNRPGRPFTNPYSGRSHIKFAVVNDYVFVGGANLSSSREVDSMVGWRDAAAARWLGQFADAVFVDRSVRVAMRDQDKSLVLDNHTTLMVDVGTPGTSHIYAQALELIDAATRSIVLTCQYFPNDVTARHLAAARKRGVDIRLIFNHPSKHHRPVNLIHHTVLLREKLAHDPALFAHQLPRSHDFLHAKLLVTDQGSIVGSNNYVQKSVTYGTAEIALYSTDKQFGHSALVALERCLG